MTKTVPREKVKDLLITKTAIKTLTSENIVEKIISFQGKDASRAIKTNNEVEFSGFGKFMVSSNKLRKRIDALEKMIVAMNETLSLPIEESKKKDTERKLKSTEETLSILKTKQKDELKTDSGGVEEQFDSPSGVERGN